MADRNKRNVSPEVRKQVRALRAKMAALRKLTLRVRKEVDATARRIRSPRRSKA